MNNIQISEDQTNRLSKNTAQLVVYELQFWL